MNIVRSQGRKQQCHRICHNRKREKVLADTVILTSFKVRKRERAYTHTSMRRIFGVRRRSHAAQSYTFICARLNVRHSKYKFAFVVAVVSVFVYSTHIHTSATTTNLNCRLHLVSLLVFFSCLSFQKVKNKSNSMI